MTRQYKRFILVLDDFYANPFEVREFASSLNYYEVPNATGFRSDKLYNPLTLKKHFERLLNIKITKWSNKHEDENGIFFLAFSKGARKEKPAIHTDPELNDITVVIYLTPDLPSDCGTSFWRHKKTGLCDEPTASDARRLKMSLKKLSLMFDDQALNRSKWEELDRVAYKFNRMVAFPSGVFHSGTNHFGANFTDGRIIQTFRLEVDWNTFNQPSRK